MSDMEVTQILEEDQDVLHASEQDEVRIIPGLRELRNGDDVIGQHREESTDERTGQASVSHQPVIVCNNAN